MRILRRGIDPPFWWKPWIPLVEWWERPRKVSARKYARLARRGKV